MEIFRTIHEMQAWSMAQKRQGKTIGIVPTMGFLHEGHLSLIDAARANGADLVVGQGQRLSELRAGHHPPGRAGGVPARRRHGNGTG